MWPSNPTTKHIPWVNQNWKRQMYSNVHWNTIYNSWYVEATYMSMNRWMNKEAVVHIHNGIFSSVQSLSRVRLFATPWIPTCQPSLSITYSQSSLKLTSIKSVMPSSHLIFCRPLLLLPPIPPNIRVFSNESTLRMRWPKYWSFRFSIIPSIQWNGWISLQSKGLSRVFSNTTVQKHQFFGAQLSSQCNYHIHTWPQEKP